MTNLSQSSKSNVYANWLRRMGPATGIGMNMLFSCAEIAECRLKMLGLVQEMFNEMQIMGTVLHHFANDRVDYPALESIGVRSTKLAGDYVRILKGDINHVRK